jgi:hypothetical protein
VLLSSCCCVYVFMYLLLFIVDDILFYVVISPEISHNGYIDINNDIDVVCLSRLQSLWSLVNLQPTKFWYEFVNISQYSIYYRDDFILFYIFIYIFLFFVIFKCVSSFHLCVIVSTWWGRHSDYFFNMPINPNQYSFYFLFCCPFIPFHRITLCCVSCRCSFIVFCSAISRIHADLIDLSFFFFFLIRSHLH